MEKQIVITNVLGIEIIRKKLHEDVVKINLSETEKGLYFVTFSVGNEVYTKKLILN